MLDCEMLGMAGRFIGGLDVSESALAFDAIAEAGPGGTFLETQHVLERYRDAFFEAELFDNASFEQWRDEGRIEAPERAAAKREKVLADYEAPELDAGIAEALDDFVARRKRGCSSLPLVS